MVDFTQCSLTVDFTLCSLMADFTQCSLMLTLQGVYYCRPYTVLNNIDFTLLYIFAAARKAKLSSAERPSGNKSLFYKHSIRKHSSIPVGGSLGPVDKAQCVKGPDNNDTTKDINSAFKFNFHITDHEQKTGVESVSDNNDSANLVAETLPVNQPGFQKSDNSFRFNFACTE